MKSIIFSTDMVRAILKGYKTQTRMVIIPQPCALKNGKPYISSKKGYAKEKYKIDDILYVRETFYECINNNDRIYYAASEIPHDTEKRKYKKKPSIFMPKEVARIFLRVTKIRIERLQDITYDDIEAEGIRIFQKDTEDGEDYYYELPAGLITDIQGEAFSDLWDSMNKKRGYGWETNPFVFVYDFVIAEVAVR